MKCIRCGTDSNLRDRTQHQGRCKSCGHPFAFEPTAMSTSLKFTDGFFAKLIQDLSVNDTLFFTERQLYYLFNRRLDQKAKRQMNGLQGCGIVVLFLSLPLLGVGIGLVTIPIGILLLNMGWQRRRRLLRQNPTAFQVDQSQFRQWYQRWQQVNGRLEKLLPPMRQETAPVAVSLGVTDYSFDRVVVCQSDSVAHLLIANNLHFEHNCAVISLNGYPFGIFDTVMEMLRRNPSLTVYALHDASPAGVRLVETLRLPKWFPDTATTLHNLGLLPRHGMTMKGVFVRQSDTSAQQAGRLPDRVRQHLLPEELNWLLAGKFVELESFGPKKLLQVVSRGISRSRSFPSFADGADDSWSSESADGSSLIIFSDGFG